MACRQRPARAGQWIHREPFQARRRRGGAVGLPADGTGTANLLLAKPRHRAPTSGSSSRSSSERPCHLPPPSSNGADGTTTSAERRWVRRERLRLGTRATARADHGRDVFRVWYALYGRVQYPDTDGHRLVEGGVLHHRTFLTSPRPRRAGDLGQPGIELTHPPTGPAPTPPAWWRRCWSTSSRPAAGRAPISRSDSAGAGCDLGLPARGHAGCHPRMCSMTARAWPRPVPDAPARRSHPALTVRGTGW